MVCGFGKAAVTVGLSAAIFTTWGPAVYESAREGLVPTNHPARVTLPSITILFTQVAASIHLRWVCGLGKVVTILLRTTILETFSILAFQSVGDGAIERACPNAITSVSITCTISAGVC